MKIIHCADIHLDSPMNRLGSSNRRKERKAELIKAFTNMVDYAEAESASAVIIAGDLFDQSKVTATARNAVAGCIENHPDIGFYFVKGNHDKIDFPGDMENVPDNLHMFDSDWITYDLGNNIYITGVELNEENKSTVYSKLNLDITHFNIVTMHGQESLSAQKDKTQIVSLKDLKNKNIDYLALGHIHSYKKEKLDNRGSYCYPGCLEARGFDETGEHGFAVLDIDGAARTYSFELVENPIRSAYSLNVEIGGSVNSSDIIAKIEKAVNDEGLSQDDLVEIILTGEVDFECEKNSAFIEKYFEDRFFCLKLKDNTRLKVDYDRFKLDESLKGQFIRTVESQDGLSDDDKAEIIRIGIRALMGEEVE